MEREANRTFRIEVKNSTENQIQPSGRLVNEKVQINYPKCNTEKQVFGKCESNNNRNGR